ncbi:hypothetical protein KQ306_06700 [Synechococcus sp. CS-1324]|uniref:hypothetical protein n=1 Tax=Synechococcus sp. CS-1324 TaxID=2847980 RepID=UPI00223B1E34|nr:hypothetical protein [Synechococcus sp. CS-1324]MCT0230538.1 hypothetical protein [Synechococcus sp. CS-1324]
MSRQPSQDFLQFLLGGSLFAAGIFLFTNQVMVGSGLRGLASGRLGGSGFGSFWGGTFALGAGGGFGLLMIPFGIGVAFLLADTYRKAGWFLVWASAAAVGAGVLQSLLFSFRETSLWSLMAMVVMIGGGGGLMFRSMRGYQEEERQRRAMDQDEAAAKMMDIKEELEQLKERLDQR